MGCSHCLYGRKDAGFWYETMKSFLESLHLSKGVEKLWDALSGVYTDINEHTIMGNPRRPKGDL